jgi:hypothetical protein
VTSILTGEGDEVSLIAPPQQPLKKSQEELLADFLARKRAEKEDPRAMSSLVSGVEISAPSLGASSIALVDLADVSMDSATQCSSLGSDSHVAVRQTVTMPKVPIMAVGPSGLALASASLPVGRGFQCAVDPKSNAADNSLMSASMVPVTLPAESAALVNAMQRGFTEALASAVSMVASRCDSGISNTTTAAVAQATAAVVPPVRGDDGMQRGGRRASPPRGGGQYYGRSYRGYYMGPRYPRGGGNRRRGGGYFDYDADRDRGHGRDDEYHGAAGSSE